MYASEVIDLVKVRLKNVALSKDNSILLKFVYLGMSELFRRFNLSIQIEAIHIVPNRSIYELQNRDVSLLLALYDAKGKELLQTDVSNADNWDYKIVNYKSFIINNTKETMVYALYKGSPTQIQDVDEYIALPDAMIEALVLYVSYMTYQTVMSINAQSPMNGLGNGDRAQFEQACQQLEMQGYKIPLNTERLGIICKGYV